MSDYKLESVISEIKDRMDDVREIINSSLPNRIRSQVFISTCEPYLVIAAKVWYGSDCYGMVFPVALDMVPSAATTFVDGLSKNLKAQGITP